MRGHRSYTPTLEEPDLGESDRMIASGKRTGCRLIERGRRSGKAYCPMYQKSPTLNDCLKCPTGRRS